MSAKNLQDLTGVVALQSHIHLWNARLYILDGKYVEAIEQLSTIRGKTPFAVHNFSQALIDLEISYCLFGLGKVDEALSLYQKIDLQNLLMLDVDDLLVATWMQYRMSCEDGEFGKADELLGRLDEIRCRYIDTRASLATKLVQFDQA